MPPVPGALPSTDLHPTDFDEGYDDAATAAGAIDGGLPGAAGYADDQLAEGTEDPEDHDYSGEFDEDDPDAEFVDTFASVAHANSVISTTP